MARHTEPHRHDDSLVAVDRRRRRLIIATAATVGVLVASIALVDSGSSPDSGPEQTALGSSWS